MKLHRFISNFELKQGSLVIKDEELIHQIWDVLKLRSPERIILCDGQGTEAEAEIVDRSVVGLDVKVGMPSPNTTEPRHAVTLYCAILKKENFELVCQKSVEAGVTEIIPIITERTVKLNLRTDRLGKIIREAAEQSGRGVLPRLSESMDLSGALTDSKRFKERCFFDPSGQELSIQGIQTEIALFVGPEGGWSTRELELAKESGCSLVSLGSRVLRGETAAVIATYLAAL